MKKSLVAVLGGASLALASASGFGLDAATDGIIVTIEESAVTGALPNQLTALQLSGQYDEVFEVTGLNTFNTLASFLAEGWAGGVGGDQVGTIGANAYELYALFQANGTFVDNGGDVTFTGTSGEIQLWTDPEQDTTTDVFDSLSIAAGTAAGIVRTGAGEDQLLGSASMLTFGEGTGNPGDGENGNFELIFGDWSLTPTGQNYFIAPNPFTMVLDINGNFQAFGVPGLDGTVEIRDSSANAFFAANVVPVPGTLALLGLGLAGFGFSRRKSAA